MIEIAFCIYTHKHYWCALFPVTHKNSVCNLCALIMTTNRVRSDTQRKGRAQSGRKSGSVWQWVSACPIPVLCAMPSIHRMSSSSNGRLCLHTTSRINILKSAFKDLLVEVRTIDLLKQQVSDSCFIFLLPRNTDTHLDLKLMLPPNIFYPVCSQSKWLKFTKIVLFTHFNGQLYA